jgi:hypothetical protein
VNALNRALTGLFDVLLTPLEWLGSAAALLVVSGIFGVLALLVFKHISWQKGIKAAKDRIKGHMIEIRLYQDDLGTVGAAVAKVLARNVQYLGLNIGPIVPLAIPFLFLTAQFVVRYAYDPLPVTPADARVMSGRGTLLTVELAAGHWDAVADLKVTFPSGLKPVSPLVRAPTQGRAFQEFVAIEPGRHEIVLELGSARETKLVVAGPVAERTMQPRRVSSRDWYLVSDTERWPALWPAEAAFAADSPFRVVAIAYPTRSQRWLPDGELGILLTVVVASMVFGAIAMKPLGVQI